MPNNSKMNEAMRELEEHIKATGGEKTDHLMGCLQALYFEDSLTGIFNRNFFDKMLPFELSASFRANQPHAVLFVDTDNLKPINDVKGYDKGDEAIINTALSLKNNLRTSDLVCRSGAKADEFLTLFRSTDAKGAYRAADKIRRLVNDNYDFTISGGITSSDVVGVPMLYWPRGRDAIAAFLDNDGNAEKTMAAIKKYCVYSLTELKRTPNVKNTLVTLKNVYDFIRLQRETGGKALDPAKDFEEIAAKALVHYADNAKITAKQTGKNRIMVYDFDGLGQYTESGVWVPIRMSK